MRVFGWMLVAASALLAQAAPPLPAPGQPPRDIVQRPDPTGTAIIRGRVVTGDTGQPLRQANVSLSALPPEPPRSSTASAPASGRGSVTSGMASGVVIGAPDPTGGRGLVIADMPTMIRPRTAVSDSQGGFEFANLPAGNYRVIANPPQYSSQYLAVAFGGKRPIAFGGDPGQIIVLSNGETFDKVSIALPKGAVIAGRVTDEMGQPLAQVGISGLYYPPGSTRGMRTGPGAQSDDLGHFRLFGLQEGQYAVVAEARGNTFVPPNMPNAPAEREEDRTGFVTTYYPSTADEASAQRVRTRAGGETSGIEIQMTTGRMFRIAGSIVDSQGQPLTGGNGQLMRRGVMPGMGFNGGFGTDPQGRFQMRNIPAGDYQLIVRARPMGPASPDGRMELGEFAVVPLTVSADIDGLVITTGPGATVTGQIVFEGGSPAPKPSQMRVMASVADPQMNFVPAQPATVQPDFTFTLKGVMGEYVLRPTPMPPDSYIKSISAGGDDLTDTPHQFTSKERITIVISTRASTLDGTVTDDKGQPVTDGGIILFSDDKNTWRWNSTTVRRATVSQMTGRFHMTGLRPGQYYVVAVPRERLTNVGNPGAEFFEALKKDATTVVVNEDEQRTIDLKLAGTGS